MDEVDQVDITVKQLIESVTERPELYAQNKGELVAIIWTALTIHAAAHNIPHAPRDSRSQAFPGSQLISNRYPELSVAAFAEMLKDWTIVYFEIAEAKRMKV